jgi:hypothetical protein
MQTQLLPQNHYDPPRVDIVNPHVVAMMHGDAVERSKAPR